MTKKPDWHKLVYKAEYSFEPLAGEPYHLYEREDKSIFLSLIAPDEWNENYLGSFKQNNTGNWEKCEEYEKL
tara:strand:- start:95 stop:310 length:216 start_codon:yes stop_codon:yes gene_type:complete